MDSGGAASLWAEPMEVFMFGKIRNSMLVVFGLLGVSMASTAVAAPIVAVGLPGVQIVAAGPPVIVVGAPNRYWVPGYVRYDAYGNQVHVAGYWAATPVVHRRVVTGRRTYVRTVTRSPQRVTRVRR